MNDDRAAEVLKTLAEHDRASEAPAGVEARLRQAFRRDRAKLRRRVRAIWLGAAAAVVVTAGLAILSSRGQNATPPGRGNVLGSVKVEDNSPAAANSGSEAPSLLTAQRAIPAARRISPAVAAVASGEKRSRPIVGTSGPAIPARPSAIARPPAVEETVTEFFPLIDPEPPFERGEILRVNLPASAMRFVGLPVREERLDDRVQADVLVGEEGLPRAIRFVRDDSATNVIRRKQVR
jgi:hypothetical protein